MFKITSITGKIHDTSFGGYPYKIIVTVEIPVSEFNKLCPVIGKKSGGYLKREKSVRDLGNLVLDVNNAVYRVNTHIPAHNPSIDSQGSKRASKGIKTLEFVYFLNDHDVAEKLGFNLFRLKTGEIVPKYSQYVNLYEGVS